MSKNNSNKIQRIKINDSKFFLEENLNEKSDESNACIYCGNLVPYDECLCPVCGTRNQK